MRTAMLLVAVLCGHAASAGVIALTTNGVNWGSNYYNPDVSVGDPYDGLPTAASPVWTAEYNTGAYSLIDSYLRVSTTYNTRQSFRTTSNWNLSEDTTVEMNIRIVDQLSTATAGAFSIVYGNANFYGTVIFATNLVRSGTSTFNTSAHDFTDWTTVRLTFEGMDSQSTATVKVYLNNNLAPILTNTTWTVGSTINMLRFGDPNTTSTDGTADLDYIAWTSGAIAPIPEPATIGMLGLGALITLILRNKRVK